MNRVSKSKTKTTTTPTTNKSTFRHNRQQQKTHTHFSINRQLNLGSHSCLSKKELWQVCHLNGMTLKSHGNFQMTSKNNEAQNNDDRLTIMRQSSTHPQACCCRLPLPNENVAVDVDDDVTKVEKKNLAKQALFVGNVQNRSIDAIEKNGRVRRSKKRCFLFNRRLQVECSMFALCCLQRRKREKDTKRKSKH